MATWCIIFNRYFLIPINFGFHFKAVVCVDTHSTRSIVDDYNLFQTSKQDQTFHKWQRPYCFFVFFKELFCCQQTVSITQRIKLELEFFESKSKQARLPPEVLLRVLHRSITLIIVLHSHFLSYSFKVSSYPSFIWWLFRCKWHV
jgi:hypothetical protein